MNIIGRYQNGNYTVTILSDGTKIRENDLDNLTPAFAENCDVKLLIDAMEVVSIATKDALLAVIMEILSILSL